MTTTTSGPSLFTSHLSWARAKFVSLCLLSGEDCWKEKDLQQPGTLRGRGRSLALSRGQRSSSRHGVGRWGRWECEAVLRMQVPSPAAPSPEAAAVPIRYGNTTKSGKLLFRFPKGRGRAAAVGPLRTRFVRGRRPTGTRAGTAPSSAPSTSLPPVLMSLRLSRRTCTSPSAWDPWRAPRPFCTRCPPCWNLRGKKRETERATGNGGKPQAVRQTQATPGPASCTLLWPTKRAFGFTDKGPPKEATRGSCKNPNLWLGSST